MSLFYFSVKSIYKDELLDLITEVQPKNQVHSEIEVDFTSVFDKTSNKSAPNIDNTITDAVSLIDISCNKK